MYLDSPPSSSPVSSTILNTFLSISIFNKILLTHESNYCCPVVCVYSHPLRYGEHTNGDFSKSYWLLFSQKASRTSKKLSCYE